MTRNYLQGVLAALLFILGIVSTSAQSASRCTPSVDQSDIARIRLIKLDGKKYVTHGTHGYHDWSNDVTIDLKADQLYPISLKPVYNHQSTPVYWKIWIDYNMDGDFDDLYEYALNGQGIGTIEGRLRIPKKIWDGTVTMRVAISTIGYPVGPCDDIISGEVEDYSVDITQATNPHNKDLPRGGLCVHMPSRVEISTNDIDIQKVTKKSIEVTTIQPRTQITPDNHKVNIAPNPSIYSSKITLRSQGSLAQIDRIMVINMNGKTVLDQKIETMEDKGYRIDTSKLSAGIYTVSVFRNNKMYSEKVIVTR